MQLAPAAMTMLCDQSLTDAARVIGLRIAALGDGWHELSMMDFTRMVHGYPKGETVSKHLRQLEAAGYIDRRPGGRGHSDVFSFRTVEKEGSIKLDPQNNRDLNRLESTSGPDLKALVVEGDEVGGIPPIVPLRSLDPKAEGVIEAKANELSGCRGSLTDYLIARVPAQRQYAYVQSIIGWLDDIHPGVWRTPDGGWLEKTQRTRMLAAAFNDLAASDESKMKRPVGDIANLQTKLGYLIRKRTNGGSSSGSDHAGKSESKGGSDTGQAGRRRRSYGD